MAASDTVGALAAEPGGRELAELLGRVQRIDPEVLHGMARRLATMTDGLDGSLRAVARHGTDVRGAWRGRSADALTGYLDEFGRAGTQTLATAGRMRARIDDAGRELAGLRREVDAHASRALDAARRARAEALADPARAPGAEQLAAAAMAEPTAAARTAVARAETSLGDAAGALRELAGGAAAFSRLPTPDPRPITAGCTAVEPRSGASIATVPAFDRFGAQDIDLDGGGGSSGDFTDLSSLDGSTDGDSGGAGGCSRDGGSESDPGSDSHGAGDGAGSEGGSPTTDAPGGADSGSDADADADSASSDADSDSGSGSSDLGSDSGDEDDATGDGGSDEDDGDQEDGAVTSTSTDDRSGGDGAATPAGGPQGQVGDWIREALTVLQTDGVPMDKMNPDDIATIIEHESGGDPEAINNSDSNAAKGTPSQGLMQTIGPTFDAYKLAGHGEITDPVDNIIAGVRYAIDRYGSVSDVPGVEAVARGDRYVGY